METILKEGMLFLPKDLSPLFRNKEYWKNHNEHTLSEREHLVWEEYSYQLKEFGTEQGYRWTAFLFQGMNKEDFYSLSRRTWERVSTPRSESSVFPQPEMVDLIGFLHQHAWKVYIVTASPEPGIAAIAHHFPVPEQNVIGMRQEVDANGKFKHQLIEPYTYGEGKVEAIKGRIGELPDLAFGDSFNDYPMLCSAKKLGVAIDKGNPEFVNACKEKGIAIQPFFRFQETSSL